MHVSMCVCVYVYSYSSQNVVAGYIATLSFSSHFISFIFALHQLSDAKDTFSFYFALAVSCRLIAALFFAFSFMSFSLSLSCLSAFVVLLLSLSAVAVVKTQATVSATGSAPSQPERSALCSVQPPLAAANGHRRRRCCCCLFRSMDGWMPTFVFNWATCIVFIVLWRP